MRIVFAASEVYPFSKTGGLGDVAGALPGALQQLGHEVLVISPWYAHLNARPYWIGDIQVPFDGKFETTGIGTLERDGVRYAFIGNPLFSREQLYGYADDTRRFALFTRAIAPAAERLAFRPDLFHANDWHTAYLPLVLQHGRHLPDGYSGMPSLFTIHNVQFQGESELEEATWWLRLPHGVRNSWMNRLGRANAMQAGLGSATHINTVSPTYAREVMEVDYGHGLQDSFRTVHEAGRFSGLLNGLDTKVWNPATDRDLPQPYAAADMHGGKAAAKAELVRRYSLDSDRPLMAAVSRLSDQKGIDVLAAAASDLTGQGWALFILGSGDRELEDSLQELAGSNPHVAFHSGFSEALAHLTYAAADLLAIPSRFEPCGLNQMIAMRYGTLPLARSTGGLADTIQHLRTGFLFDHAAEWSLLAGAEQAMSLYGTEQFSAMQQEAMRKDFSWTDAARRYAQLYSVILDR